MSVNNRPLYNIELDELDDIREELGATQNQMIAAYNRAIKRTAVTLKKYITKDVRDTLQTRKNQTLRRRLHQSTKRRGKMSELSLWFGLDDMAVSLLKGRLQRVGTKRKPKGAIFTPKSGKAPISEKKGFVARLGSKRSIFSRIGKERFPVTELKYPIQALIQHEIEEDIYPHAIDIFLHHFRTDLRGRVRVNA